MKVFISGGCKNGKSTYAEGIAVRLSETAKPLYYIATMAPVDDEDIERIKLHRESRAGLGFETIEMSENISRIGEKGEKYELSGTYLLDSSTALLANEMFKRSGETDNNAHLKVSKELGELIRRTKNMVIVSDYIYSDAAIYDDFTNAYRRGLAYIDCECARLCDVVIEVSFGSLIFHKGEKCFRERIGDLI